MEQQWLVGQTVRIIVTVTDPVSGAAVDPHTIDLVTLARGGEPVDVEGLVPDRLGTGQYRYQIDTEGFQDGRYDWLVRLTDAEGGVALGRDYFVLAPV